MKKQNLSLTMFSVAALVLGMFLNVAAAKESPIVRFNGRNGLQPRNGLTADGKGNYYGVTTNGGNSSCPPHGCGVVFELSPGSNGTWTENVIYAFKGGASDTSWPETDLIFDGNGNLFGATGVDGSSFGAVYELTPGTGGTWTEKILYSFNNQGYDPGTHLAFDSQGNLYGSLLYTFGDTGGVFQLSPQANGTWKESLIYTFTGTNGDGKSPYGGVVFDGEGNIYGTTYSGGTSGHGTVYELSPNGSGGFAETIIYTFTGQADGFEPQAPLSIDAKGDLFGTTLSGEVFELTQAGGKWSDSVLYTFGAPPDGSHPWGVVLDAKGNLYGTTSGGGAGCNSPGCGIVFKLSPQTSGSWKETILQNFESAGDGSEPNANVVLDNSSGHIYGTTTYGGGRVGYGTVFEIQP